MVRRRRGFTLIELLVVIAIIAILAAMLFPVFARARESARKIQCLSNVKNVAMAVQMYLADWDRYMVLEHRAEVLAYYDAKNPDGGYSSSYHCAHGTYFANPYLRMPVLLDEYIRNRDVWRCPSAKFEQGAISINGWPDWFAWRLKYDGQVCHTNTCCPQYPNGWGGTVTDSGAQQMVASGIGGTKDTALGAFAMSLTINRGDYEAKESQISDPSAHGVVADGGNVTDELAEATAAYPDVCLLDCGNSVCSWVDWENCSENASCGLYNRAPTSGVLLSDLQMRKSYARHLGGTNVGFWDGHAAWISSEALIDAVEAGQLQGFDVSWGPRSYCGFAEEYPGVPTLR
jgi:prepilin-type N-terminal cleavage/methylation domain-containing protein/prepilin-type processing-associated H-X9-DG protein